MILSVVTFLYEAMLLNDVSDLCDYGLMNLEGFCLLEGVFLQF